MGQYVALQRIELAGKDYLGGDVLPGDAIDPERVGGAIYAGVVVYVPDPGEQYAGPWPGEHHHYSTEMQVVVDNAIARASAVAPKPKAAPKEPAPEAQADPVPQEEQAKPAPQKRAPTKRAPKTDS